MEYTAFIIYLCRGDASLNLHCCTSRVWTACLIEQRFTYGKSHGDSSRQVNGSKGMEETKLDRLITQWKCQKVWGESTMHQWCDQKRDTKCHHPNTHFITAHPLEASLEIYNCPAKGITCSASHHHQAQFQTHRKCSIHALENSWVWKI